ncbi:hypothetical protein Patl1_34420 [Pistacia atlantica]|uniref:Uncharacterized protein n=1 Tax=Pistacia atlantica TaxID=434234 RepID=A0ACC0ZU71_9ROSI|nr:hypothetical protein Patl1_34420 [Pistacia atlantica]
MSGSVVEHASKQYRKRTNQVEGWLERVQLELQEVQNILQKGEQEIQKKCLGGWCPRNCYSSCKLVDEIPVDKTVGMDSILNEVWRCLDGHQVRIIGMYGLGGVGKTTLLKKLNNKFIDKRHGFDVVIWVTVSKEVNLVGIQEVIRHKLQIPDETWEKKTDEHSRATEICRSLSGKRFVLLLDDLWERIDLRNMGVPDLSYHQNGSKIVFTTRSEDVCHSMDAAVKKFEVKEFAETVAKECKGLPLALITIGRAMSNRRTPEEWRYAINTLQSHPSEFADMESKDHMIRKDELIDLWIVEGILHNYGLNDTRDAGEFIIRSLKHACLLEKVGDSDDFVKMHDVLRDMAM